ncbi:hypothetical protein D3C77_240650 [compost metagenome]
MSFHTSHAIIVIHGCIIIYFKYEIITLRCRQMKIIICMLEHLRLPNRERCTALIQTGHRLLIPNRIILEREQMANQAWLGSRSLNIRQRYIPIAVSVDHRLLYVCYQFSERLP